MAGLIVLSASGNIIVGKVERVNVTLHTSHFKFPFADQMICQLAKVGNAH